MKELSYEDFIAFSQKHYYIGGDAVVECWDRKTFDKYVSMFGPITMQKANEIIQECQQEEAEELALLFGE